MIKDASEVVSQALSPRNQTHPCKAEEQSVRFSCWHLSSSMTFGKHQQSCCGYLHYGFSGRGSASLPTRLRAGLRWLPLASGDFT